jgi:hypothetical protein
MDREYGVQLTLRFELWPPSFSSMHYYLRVLTLACGDMHSTFARFLKSRLLVERLVLLFILELTG